MEGVHEGSDPVNAGVSFGQMALMIELSANTEKRYHPRSLRFIGVIAIRHCREAIMRERFSGSMTTVAIAGAAVGVVISASITPASAQAAPPPALATPWGEPDLQGIWTDETDTTLQRSPKYASQEFFTDEQRAEVNKMRAGFVGRHRRSERGTEADVAGAYNAVFTPLKPTGTRTSRIVDPPNGRLPPLTPEAQKL